MSTPTGRVVGNFVVDDELDGGGMGELLVGMQPSLQRPAVLKRLRRELAAHPEYVSRFRREACTAAAIHHQNVVAVYDCFSFRGHEYIALEYVDGLDLRRALEQAGPFHPRLAALIMLEIARGMEAIHARGMVHRDLKPANVLLGRRGEVKVTDFGIALDPAGTQLTRPGFSIGTPPYMSPEQMQGERVDVRSDIFSMGVVLYEMLVGHPPYIVPQEDDRDSLLSRMRREDYPSLKQVSPSTPRVLRRLADDCLRTKPRRRLASVRAMRAVLEKHLGRPTTADSRAEIADWLWDLSLFEVRDGETLISRGRKGAGVWSTRLHRAAYALTIATAAALLTVVLLQQRTLLRSSQQQLLEELATVLPRAWEGLPHPWEPGPAARTSLAAPTPSLGSPMPTPGAPARVAAPLPAVPAARPAAPLDTAVPAPRYSPALGPTADAVATPWRSTSAGLPETPAPSLATLRLRLQPGAQAYVDGARIEPAAWDSLAVRPGSHLVLVEQPDGACVEERLELMAGDDRTFWPMISLPLAEAP